MGETPFPNHAAALEYAELNGLNLVWAGTTAFEKRQRALSSDQFQVRPVHTRKGITMAGLFSKEITSGAKRIHRYRQEEVVDHAPHASVQL
jgi:hypothetical protein